MIKVKLVYRNYKPLHQAYASMVAHPPPGITYQVPSANQRLRRLHKIYRKIRFFGFARPLIRLAERVLFVKKPGRNDADIYQYLNIMGQPPPGQPYIVDTEHAAGLISFTPDSNRLVAAREFLRNPDCKAVTCWSQAAQRTVQQLMGDEYEQVASKVHIVYPAAERPVGLRADTELIKPNTPSLKLLSVGNQAYLKGTEELLAALNKLNRKYGSDILELHIVSDDAGEVVSKYALDNVKLYRPVDKKTVLQKFYLPADIFIMPTKQDTFGMALLDALACGTMAITTDQFACRELIDDGKDGLLLKINNPVMDSDLVPDKRAMDSVMRPNLDEQLADQIYTALSRILEGKIDYHRMSRAGPAKFSKNGKFSIETRRRKMASIYTRALEEEI